MTRLTQFSLSHWLRFFKQNADYSAYCAAKKVGDRVTCATLETQFDRIAELFLDWGDIGSVEPVAGSTSFNKWMMPRKHLFLDYSFVGWVEDPVTYAHTPGHLLLDVLLSDKESETISEVTKYLKRFYASRSDAMLRSSKPAMRLVCQTLPMPKYMLHTPSGKFNAASSRNLKKAVYVDSFRRQGKNLKPLSTTDTVLAIKQDSKNPLGWSLTADDIDALKRGTFAKSILGGSEVTLIKRHRKDYDAYVHNTIHGRFPDNS